MTDLSRSDIIKISIDHVNHFRIVKLHGLNLENIDLSGLDLSGFSFQGSKLCGASFVNSNLTRCYFTDADLTDCDFTGAKGLSQEMFRDAITDRVVHNLSNGSF